MPEEQKPNLKKTVADLIQVVFDSDGDAGLRDLEELFAESIRKFRSGEAELFVPGDLDSGPVHRERYADIIGESAALMRVQVSHRRSERRSGR